MALPAAPRMRTCLIAYYGALFALGMIWTLYTYDPVSTGVGDFFLGGVALISIVHLFFFLAPSILGDWLSYLMVGGDSSRADWRILEA